MIGLHLFEGNPKRALPLLEPHGPGISEPGPDGRWWRAINVLYLAGEADRAADEARAYEQHLRVYLADHPDQPVPYRHLVLLALVAGDIEAARQHWATAEGLRRPDAVLQGTVAAQWADTFAMFGDADSAFAQMEEALRVPAGYTWQYVKLSSAYAGLRDDPRYAKLEKRYGGGS
jgi:hypothetical protein